MLRTASPSPAPTSRWAPPRCVAGFVQKRGCASQPSVEGLIENPIMYDIQPLCMPTTDLECLSRGLWLQVATSAVKRYPSTLVLAALLTLLQVLGTPTLASAPHMFDLSFYEFNM